MQRCFNRRTIIATLKTPYTIKPAAVISGSTPATLKPSTPQYPHLKNQSPADPIEHKPIKHLKGNTMAEESRNNNTRTQSAENDFRTKRRETNRALLQEKMAAFIQKATDGELYSLLDYVGAKEAYIAKYNSANRDDRKLRNEIMAERLNRVRTMVVRTESVAEIMAALPVVDAVLGDSVGMMERFVSTKQSNLDTVLEQMKSVNQFKIIIEEAKESLLPLVDIACEKNLVRDRSIKDDFRLRKAVEEEMKKAGIDPNSEDAHEKYEEFKVAQAKRLEEERAQKEERRRAAKEAEELNAKLKQELGIDPNDKQGSAALRAAKEEMKAFGIDPASKTAVKDLLKKRKEKPATETVKETATTPAA
jgi:hypothetical protein